MHTCARTHAHTHLLVWAETENTHKGCGGRAGRLVVGVPGGLGAKGRGRPRGGSPAEPAARRPRPELHDAALGLVRVGVLEPQSLLRPVLFQVGELFAVDGAAPLPGQTGPGWGVRQDPGSATRPAPELQAPEAREAGAGPRDPQSPPTSGPLPGPFLPPESQSLQPPRLTFKSPGYGSSRLTTSPPQPQGPHPPRPPCLPGCHPPKAEPTGMEPGMPAGWEGEERRREVALRCLGGGVPSTAHQVLPEVICPHRP